MFIPIMEYGVEILYEDYFSDVYIYVKIAMVLLYYCYCVVSFDITIYS